MKIVVDRCKQQPVNSLEQWVEQTSAAAGSCDKLICSSQLVGGPCIPHLL